MIDAQGRSVANVPVRINSRSGVRDQSGFRARQTDSDGRFLFTGLRPGIYSLVVEDGSDTRSEWFSIRDRQRVERDLRLPFVGSLHMTVTEREGQAVRSAKIDLWCRDGSGEQRSPTQTARRPSTACVQAITPCGSPVMGFWVRRTIVIENPSGEQFQVELDRGRDSRSRHQGTREELRVRGLSRR